MDNDNEQEKKDVELAIEVPPELFETVSFLMEQEFIVFDAGFEREPVEEGGYVETEPYIHMFVQKSEELFSESERLYSLIKNLDIDIGPGDPERLSIRIEVFYDPGDKSCTMTLWGVTDQTIASIGAN